MKKFDVCFLAKPKETTSQLNFSKERCTFFKVNTFLGELSQSLMNLKEGFSKQEIVPLNISK